LVYVGISWVFMGYVQVANICYLFSNIPTPWGPCSTEPINAATDENSHISCGAVQMGNMLVRYPPKKYRKHVKFRKPGIHF
jgi:hypothetical protein